MSIAAHKILRLRLLIDWRRHIVAATSIDEEKE